MIRDINEPTFSIARFSRIEMVKRDKLIALLLQDRATLRLLSAPHGFGKSVLAYEYAQRMFSNGRVLWIDSDTPEFLDNLDRGSLIPSSEQENGPFDLVVVDNLPFLDEQRLTVFLKLADEQLYAGTEVIVTLIPSHDCIRANQPDRVLLTAADFLVSEEECKAPILVDNSLVDPDEKAQAAWAAACSALFGRVAQVAWGHSPKDVECCMAAFFSEPLPREVFRTTFCMLLLGKGNFDDLRALGLDMRPETQDLLMSDYPFLGIDSVQYHFKVGTFDLDALRRAISKTGVAQVVTGGEYPLAERVLGVLIGRGEVHRAGEILERFCTDERCGLWLQQNGWSLLNSNEVALCESLFDRCGRMHMPSELITLRAWSCGINGELKEASRFAQSAIRQEQLAKRKGTNLPGMLGYLALTLFSDGGPALYAKDTYFGGTVLSPVDFLAAVVDLCSENELARALSFGFANRAACLDKQRSDPSEEKVSTLTVLFTQYADQFEASLPYQMALHFLFFVDCYELHGVFLDLGCLVAHRARHSGVTTFIQALLIVDLWKAGYFGASRRALDIRDMRVLDEAASMLGKLGRGMIGEPLPVPWEVNALRAASMPELGPLTIETKVAPAAKLNMQAIPPVNVSLFGGFEVMVGDMYQSESDWRPKCVALFALLVLFQGRDTTKDFIFKQLWPKSNRARSQDNFYTLWSQVQTLLGSNVYLIKQGDFCRINPRFVNSDVGEFEQLTRRLLTERNDMTVLLDIYARMEALYQGGLLPSMVKVPYIGEQAKRYVTMFVDAMCAGTEKALEAKDVRMALWFASKAKEIDSQREDVYYANMTAQIAAGQRCSAIRTYFACQDYMREQLGLDPSAEIQGLYDQLIALDPSLLKLNSASLG